MGLKQVQALQDLAELASVSCGVAVGLIKLMDNEDGYILFKSQPDLELKNILDIFFPLVYEQQDTLIISDAQKDDRFSQNPLLKDTSFMRFYAGVPLVTQKGRQTGCLCLIDPVPRILSDLQKRMLKLIAGQVTRLLESAVSISRLQDQLMASEIAGIELRSFIESSVDAHLLLGKDFEVLNFNNATEKLSSRQYGKQLLRGAQMTPYLHPDFSAEFFESYQNALNGKAIVQQRLIRYSDGPVWWIVKYTPVYNESRDIIGVSVSATDVTRSVLQEQQVLLQKASLEEIAFIQSHELRRPVASILGLMNILKEEGMTEKVAELRLLETCVLELDEMIRLIVGQAEKANLPDF